MSKSKIEIRRKRDGKILRDEINDACQTHNIYDGDVLVESDKDYNIGYSEGNGFLDWSEYELADNEEQPMMTQEAMINEDYSSFEISKLLKEKGFDIPCREHYYQYGELSPYSTEYNNWNSEEDYYSCPTLQMVTKWLREKGIIITIVYTRYSMQTIGSQMMFGFNIQNAQGELLSENTDVAYDSYEQAEIGAIKYSLENLI